MQELASAANLENLELNDYLCFRVIARINGFKSVDKTLAILAQDFNLEEVNRVASACESTRIFFFNLGHQTTKYMSLMDSFRGDKKIF